MKIRLSNKKPNIAKKKKQLILYINITNTILSKIFVIMYKVKLIPRLFFAKIVMKG